jgi:hypothetical protein
LLLPQPLAVQIGDCGGQAARFGQRDPVHRVPVLGGPSFDRRTQGPVESSFGFRRVLGGGGRVEAARR